MACALVVVTRYGDVAAAAVVHTASVLAAGPMTLAAPPTPTKGTHIVGANDDVLPKTTAGTAGARY